jgi:hypothetical protein
MKMIKILPLVSIVFLPACASQADFPSLAPRPIELAGQNGLAPATPPVPGQSDPATLQRANAALQKAQASVAPFNSALAAARGNLSGINAAKGSEAWVQAQLSLSRLAQLARPASEALADLEDIKRQMVFSAPSPDYPAIDAQWRSVFSINAAQNEALAALTSSARP